MNLYSVLESGFPADRDAVCLTVPGGRDRTWRDVDEGSGRLANWLAGLGLPRGSRIAAPIEKSPEGLMLYLAALRAGHVFLPLNTAYRDAELSHFFTDAAPAVVVCPVAARGWMEPVASQAGVPHVVTLDADGTGSLADAAAACAGRFATVDVPDDDLAALLYTSGTTGRSKGAMLSHGNLASNVRVLHAAWAWSPSDVLLHMLPIFHVHGLFVAGNGGLFAGARTIWLPKFDAAAALRHLADATIMMGVPTFYVRLLGEPGLTRDACRSVRLFISGSAPLLPETFTAFRDRTGHSILERYGMSETGMLTSNPCRAEEGPRMCGTVGRPLPGVTLRVTGDDGGPCRVGEIGMIEVKGPNVFRGYWNLPDKTAAEFTRDGFFRTGDLGRLGGETAGERVPDDYVSIVGRGKDLIISGGFNVYPKEIEDFIDGIEGVQESAVVGVPHPDFGEAGVAFVVPRPGAVLDAAAIQAALKARIANFKVPKLVEIVPELPRNAMGKVQKNLLRERRAAAFTG